MRIKAFLVNLLFKVSPGLGKLAEERAALSAQLDRVRDDRDALNRQLQTQAVSNGVLMARVVELTAQVRMQMRRGFDEAISSPTPLVQRSPSVTRRAAKFVVFSNPRSGSTWLETSLGLLPDVYVDYELKWDVTYAASELHIVLDQSNRTISQLLEDMDTDAPVVGSKFVFDVPGLPAPDIPSLAAQIGPDVRIIHLTRDYRDVFLSIRRGFHHVAARTDRLGERLRNAIDSADIRHMQENGALHVSAPTCLNELSGLLDNDLHVQSLRAAGFPYLQVSYDKIGERLAEIAEFSGSQAAPELIADVLARPAVVKLPAIEPHRLVTNLDELEPVFESFEILRQALVVQAKR